MGRRGEEEVEIVLACLDCYNLLVWACTGAGLEGMIFHPKGAYSFSGAE